MTIIFICILSAVALGIFIYALIPRSSEVHDRVAQLSGSHSENARKIILFERLLDEKSKNEMQRRLQEAGWYDVTPGKIAFRSMLGMVIGLVAAMCMIFMFHFSGIMQIFAYMMPILGYMYPRMKLSSAVKERKMAVQCELPDFLDMVSSTLAAGIALNGALLTAVDMCEGPLGDEFRATLADIRMGRSRADALNSMAERVNQQDLTQMVTAIVQSERVGGSITSVLEELASESRERRLMRAEELAGTLPIKMTLPMAFFLLPALFTVIFGPVVANMKI